MRSTFLLLLAAAALSLGACADRRDYNSSPAYERTTNLNMQEELRACYLLPEQMAKSCIDKVRASYRRP